MNKKCSACKKTKQEDNFRVVRRANRKPSVCGTCILCERIYDKNRGHTVLRRFVSYEGDSRRKNRIFEITLKEFEKTTNKKCKYCGGYSKGSDGKKYCGLDRVDSSKGYTINNIVPCCDTCNYMKGSLTYEDFINHVKNIYNYLKKSILINV